MRILALGATGFVGSRVVNQFVDEGHDVTVFHRGETKGSVSMGARVVHGDRNTLVDTIDVLLQTSPDVVVDVVPYTEAQVRQVVTLLQGRVERIVAVSSADVYRNYDGFRGVYHGEPDSVPLTESAPLRENLYPYRGYGLPFDWADEYDKILVENAYRSAADLPATILRLPAVFGPGDAQRRLAPYLRRMDDQRPAILLSERQATWQWTRGYVDDIAAAIVQATLNPYAAGHTYNVGYEQAHSERAWVEAIGRAAGWSGEVVVVTNDALPESLRQPFDWGYDLALDTSAVRRDLGYDEVFSVEAALEATIAWERGTEPIEAPDYEPEDTVLERLGH